MGGNDNNSSPVYLIIIDYFLKLKLLDGCLYVQPRILERGKCCSISSTPIDLRKVDQRTN